MKAKPFEAVLQFKEGHRERSEAISNLLNCYKPALARRDTNIMEFRRDSSFLGHTIITFEPGLGQGLLRRFTPRNDKNQLWHSLFGCGFFTVPTSYVMAANRELICVVCLKAEDICRAQ